MVQNWFICKLHCRILNIMNNMQLEMLHKLNVGEIIYMATLKVQVYRVWNWAYHKHESNFEVQASNLECFEVLILGSLRHASEWWSLLQTVQKLCFWLLFVNIMVLVIIDYGGSIAMPMIASIGVGCVLNIPLTIGVVAKLISRESTLLRLRLLRSGVLMLMWLLSTLILKGLE